MARSAGCLRYSTSGSRRAEKEPLFVSHELELAEASTGYAHVDKRDDGRAKVVLHP